MQQLFKRLETLWVAITFAEAGEFETARQMVKQAEAPPAPARVVPGQAEGVPS